MPGICRVEDVKALGVTISRKFSVSLHVDELLTKINVRSLSLRRELYDNTGFRRRPTCSIPGCCC